MQYIRAICTWTESELPIEIWSEIDDERYETRKIDRFRDGRIRCASENFEEGDTWLGDKPWPELEGFNTPGSEVTAVYISASEFEARWREVTAHRTQGG